MTRYLIHRKIGDVSESQLHEAAVTSKRVREESFPDITWEHSHVVATDAGLATFCVYAAPSEERVREHAKAAGLPADAIYEIRTDVSPDQL